VDGAQLVNGRRKVRQGRERQPDNVTAMRCPRARMCHAARTVTVKRVEMTVTI
jgi:hypothetical protein